MRNQNLLHKGFSRYISKQNAPWSKIFQQNRRDWLLFENLLRESCNDTYQIRYTEFVNIFYPFFPHRRVWSYFHKGHLEQNKNQNHSTGTGIFYSCSKQMYRNQMKIVKNTLKITYSSKFQKKKGKYYMVQKDHK